MDNRLNPYNVGHQHTRIKKIIQEDMLTEPEGIGHLNDDGVST